jgi:hypothetical protein
MRTLLLSLITPFALLLAAIDWAMPGPHTLTVRGWFDYVRSVRNG